jgi:hypothetical protein
VTPRVALVLALAVAGPPLQAAELKSTAVTPVAAPADARLAGHYYLNGIMETGSELLLREDGRFQWYFTYGALDLEAEGRWQREGDAVVLLPEVFHYPPQHPETEFKRMRLRIDGDELIPAWPWEQGAERGRYARD